MSAEQEDEEREPSDLEQAQSRELYLGKALWEALNSNTPTVKQLRERRRLAKAYAMAAEELLEEMIS